MKPGPSTGSATARLLYGLTWAAWIVVVASLVVVVFLPYAPVKAFTDQLPRDGDLKLMTPERFRTIKILCGVCAMLGIIGAVAYGRGRARVISLIQLQVDSWRELCTAAVSRLNTWRRHETVRHKAIAALVLAGGISLRWFYVVTQGIHHDEAKTLFNSVNMSVAETLSNFGTLNNHVFHSLLAKLSVGLFGDGVVALRLPVFVAGVLSLLLLYVWCRRTFGRREALLCLGIGAGAYPLVQASSNARGYTLVALFFLVLLLVLPRVLDRRDRASRQVFIAAAAVGMWTVPTMVYPLAVAYVWMLVSALPGERKEAIRFVGLSLAWIAAVTGLLYLPVVVRMGAGALAGDPYMEGTGYAALAPWAIGWPLCFAGWMVHGIGGYGAVIPVVLVGIALALEPSGERTTARLLCSAVLPSLAIVLIVRSLAPTRAWVFLAPVYAAVAARGIVLGFRRLAGGRLGDRWVNGATVLIFVAVGCCVCSVVGEPIYVGGSCQSASRIVESLGPRLEGRNVVEAASPCTGPILYYLERGGIPAERLYWYSEGNPNAAATDRFDTIFLVVKPGGSDIPSFGYGVEIGSDGYEPPSLSSDFGETRVYELRRR